MFFSERGEEIPFTIQNIAERDEYGQELVRWNRTFYFHNKKRYFNAVMQLDENENEIVDYFGEPHLLVSTLHFHIDELGQCILLQRNNGFICLEEKFRCQNSCMVKQKLLKVMMQHYSVFEFMYKYETR